MTWPEDSATSARHERTGYVGRGALRAQVLGLTAAHGGLGDGGGSGGGSVFATLPLGGAGGGSGGGSALSRSEVWRAMAAYAFVFAPVGNGLDTHRLWEALVLGCIVVAQVPKAGCVEQCET